MSLGKAIIGGLLFGTTGFIVGALLDDKKEIININVKQPTAQIVKKSTIEDDFYNKLSDSNFESFVNEYCYENNIDIDNISNYYMEEMMIEYDEMIEKGYMKC